MYKGLQRASLIYVLRSAYSSNRNAVTSFPTKVSCLAGVGSGRARRGCGVDWEVRHQFSMGDSVLEG